MALQVSAAEVHVLEETLAKVSSLTGQVNATLGKISSNADFAEKAITPISGRTKMFAILTRSVDSSLSVIEEIRGYANITGECETIIKAGPEASGISTYINTIERLHTSLDELMKSQLRKFYKVVDKTEALIKSGNNQLKEYFRSILASAYEQVDINKCLEGAKTTPNNTAQMPSLSDENVNTVATLFEYFRLSKQSLDDLYVEMATRVVSTSLAPFHKEALKARTASSMTSYKPGTCALNPYAIAVRGLIVARADDLTLIGAKTDNDKQKMYLLDQVTKVLLNDFIQVCTTINDFINKNMETEQILVFEVVDAIMAITGTLRMILIPVPANLTELMAKAKATAKRVFVEFLKMVESKVNSATYSPGEQFVPTLDIMSKLKQIAEFKNGAPAAIEGLAPGSWMPQPEPEWKRSVKGLSSITTQTGNDPWNTLSAFFSDAIDALILTLELRLSASGKKDHQIGLTLLLNLAFIESYITKSNVSAVLSVAGAERLQRLRKHAFDLFLRAWHKVSHGLMETTLPAGKQLSSKDREVVKEKFKVFNAEFEALLTRHKSLNIKDVAIKQESVKEIKSLVGPIYYKFYDRHKGGDFTKNIDKYIKYDKVSLDKAINTLLL
ncbi:Exo70p [Sugiyamaella lignohabitans]|uniref:Exocyst complex protein EXO70 n=1 Tax=Sugiyamaella lignohabitans TaxID=796027 RepID=A0A167F8H9_9ASCO|nr:Exo70p [Sugiyamaella lignohabitans]ANB14954.1 Exo70p [Sugiyamaella lignohabitans]